MEHASEGLRLAHHARARVQSGHRIVPGLDEGQDVDVFLIARPPDFSEPTSVIEFLDVLPAGPRSASTWNEVEEQFQGGRNEWDR